MPSIAASWLDERRQVAAEQRLTTREAELGDAEPTNIRASRAISSNVSSSSRGRNR